LNFQVVPIKAEYKHLFLYKTISSFLLTFPLLIKISREQPEITHNVLNKPGMSAFKGFTEASFLLHLTTMLEK
jgi:hypothetical protein